MARHAIRTEDRMTVIPENPIPLKYWVVEPVVCIVNGLVYAQIQPGDAVALVGAGYMGLIFAQGLAKTWHGRLSPSMWMKSVLPLRKGLVSRKP